jgi:hypothetical protein
MLAALALEEAGPPDWVAVRDACLARGLCTASA